MDTFEIRDKDIDVEEIICKIKENIKKRNEKGAYPEGELETLCMDPDPIQDSKKFEISRNTNEIQKDIDYINTNWDIQNIGYFISSHRHAIGKALIKGREVVHGEVQRYVDPMIWKQRDFNGSVVRILNELTKRINSISVQIDDRLSQNQARFSSEIDDKISQAQAKFSSETDDKISQAQAKFSSETDDKISQAKSQFSSETNDKISQGQAKFSSETDDKISQVHTKFSSEIDDMISHIQTEFSSEIDHKMSQNRAWISSEIDRMIRAVYGHIEGDIKNKLWLSELLDDEGSKIKRKMGEKGGKNDYYINYFLFSDEISKAWTELSGKSIDSPNIFEDSLSLFKNCKNVLDIGCGNGYFLQLMKENDIGGYGIDLNEDLVIYCKKIGVNAIKIDASSHLQSIDNKSLDGIFMNQVAEHMSVDAFYEILKLGYEKLQYGSYIIITIPNILSVLVSSNLFFLDPTHERHLHPEVIKFLLKSCGFREIREQFYQPVPDEIKLGKLDIGDYPNGENMIKIMDIYNKNIDILNNIIFGFRDCTILGKK